MKYVALAASILTLAACSDSTSPRSLQPPPGASKEVVQNQTLPFAMATTNPCNGDAVALTGTTHILVEQTQNDNGLHLTFDETSHFTGVGVPSGLTYNSDDRTLDTINWNGGFPVEETFVAEHHLISQTGADNYTVGIHSHYTINSNGTLTADPTYEWDRCDG